MDDRIKDAKADKKQSSLPIFISFLSLAVTSLNFLNLNVDRGDLKVLIGTNGGTASFTADKLSLTPERITITFLNSRNAPVALFGIGRTTFGTADIVTQDRDSCPIASSNTQSLIAEIAPTGDFNAVSIPAHDMRTIAFDFPNETVETAPAQAGKRHAVACLKFQFASVGGRLSSTEMPIAIYNISNEDAPKVYGTRERMI